MGGRHGASSGGRSVGEIFARVAMDQGGTAAVAPTRSAFTVAAAATVGAGMAAAGATGTFPAIQVPDLPDFDASGSVAHIAPAAASNALPAAPVSSGAVSSAPAHPISSSTGTVMAGDLHQTDATEIDARSRAVRMAGPGDAGGMAGAVESVLDAALKLPSKIGGVPVVGLAASQDAAVALRNAATKLGKPYVWGARGPNAFDCSGLMQWAYKQAGVKLPRSSTAQSQFGKAVSVKNLQPGDMVFYYTPVSHVGMYIGNGKILHASEPGKPVKISDVDAFPIHNARRVTA